MKSVAEPLIKLLENCKNLALHTSMNRICEFAELDAPKMIKALEERDAEFERVLQENERLKERVYELEQQLNDLGGSR